MGLWVVGIVSNKAQLSSPAFMKISIVRRIFVTEISPARHSYSTISAPRHCSTDCEILRVILALITSL